MYVKKIYHTADALQYSALNAKYSRKKNPTAVWKTSFSIIQRRMHGIMIFNLCSSLTSFLIPEMVLEKKLMCHFGFFLSGKALLSCLPQSFIACRAVSSFSIVPQSRLTHLPKSCYCEKWSKKAEITALYLAKNLKKYQCCMWRIRRPAEMGVRLWERKKGYILLRLHHNKLFYTSCTFGSNPQITF